MVTDPYDYHPTEGPGRDREERRDRQTRSSAPPWESLARQHQAVDVRHVGVPGQRDPAVFRPVRRLRVYRGLYPAGFLAAGRQTDIVFGTVNTAILMTSSLALARRRRARRERDFAVLARRLLLVTVGARRAVPGHERVRVSRGHREASAARAPDFALADPGAALFFSFYWVMTGIHAVHVTGGLAALIGRLLVASRREPRLAVPAARSEEATALYWHLVDVIWIVLYPAALPRRPCRWISARRWTRMCVSGRCAAGRCWRGSASVCCWRRRAHSPTCRSAAATFPSASASRRRRRRWSAAVFMRLREDNALNRLAASAGPIWIFIMFLLIGADYFTR